MLDPAIAVFFQERKDDWLKKNIKLNLDENQILTKQQECEEIFSLEQWLPKAAKRAGQLSVASHPCTFSHPSARKNKNGYASAVIASNSAKCDGYLRFGNVNSELDALGNAAALDVYKFLSLQMTDGSTLLEHIQRDSELAQRTLAIQTESYTTLKQGFLSMITADSTAVTSSKIKQVYFPIKDSGEYHLLSILSNSGLMYTMKHRLDHLSFSDETKNSRDLKKSNSYCANGFSDIYGLVGLAYGGTKPQNISVLNNRNGGSTFVFSSVPPNLQARHLSFPKHNFFKESIFRRDYVHIISALHRIMASQTNNMQVRELRDDRIQELIDALVARMWEIRAISETQYHADSSRLKQHQKIWLLSDYAVQREESDEWLTKLMKEISRWIVLTYEKVMGRHAIKLGSDELAKISDVVNENRESFR